MKRLFIFVLLLAFPLVVFAKTDKLVKVYIFEAGGCPYCEEEINYLKGLESYNKKFKIVQKELYVDHVNWAKGKDYNTGVKVADGFKSKGYSGASADATPFVVISNLYAAAGYTTSLEDVINTAYEQGDKDIVKCVEDGKNNCFDDVPVQEGADTSDSDTTTIGADNNNSKGSSNSSVWVAIICSIVILAVYIIKSNKDKYDILMKIAEKR